MLSPKYRLDIKDNNSRMWMDSVWRVRSRTNAPGYGKPNAVNLEKYVYDYAKSLELGGNNEVISKKLGYIPYPIEARIVNQETGETVATWKAAMFQVW